MPLLTCPNDNAPMQAVQRSGVEFDVCTQCRGVWLDRGELEKLLGMARTDVDEQAPLRASQPEAQRAPQRPEYGERGEHGEYGADGRRKRRFDIFDIFD